MRRTPSGFTLVEILIVVVLLGILAAITLPKFSNATTAARSGMLADTLRIFRVQLEVYRGQHAGRAAGYPHDGGAPSAGTFVAQITGTTNELGEVRPTRQGEFRFGPYMRQMPPNPVNGKDSVRIVLDGDPFPAAASGQDGWVYKPATLEFRADVEGIDESDRPYFAY